MMNREEVKTQLQRDRTAKLQDMPIYLTQAGEFLKQARLQVIGFVAARQIDSGNADQMRELLDLAATIEKLRTVVDIKASYWEPR